MKIVDISESELRNLFVEKYQASSDISIHVEVPVFTRSVDLVLKDLKSNYITAVEFKLHDWKRAIIQTHSVGICFDFLYICLPTPKTKAGQLSIEKGCKENGVGLFLYDQESNDFKESVIAIKTSKIWDVQKQRVISYLEDSKND